VSTKKPDKYRTLSGFSDLLYECESGINHRSDEETETRPETNGQFPPVCDPPQPPQGLCRLKRHLNDQRHPALDRGVHPAIPAVTFSVKSDETAKDVIKGHGGRGAWDQREDRRPVDQPRNHPSEEAAWDAPGDDPGGRAGKNVNGGKLGRSINSRQKGAAAERFFSQMLRKYVRPDGTPVEARRGCQYSGRPDGSSCDIVHNIDGVAFEIKRVEKFTPSLVYSAVAQCQADSGDNTPVVCWRTNRREWLAILPIHELLNLLGVKPANTKTEI
jgi:hypothetical protein